MLKLDRLFVSSFIFLLFLVFPAFCQHNDKTRCEFSYKLNPCLLYLEELLRQEKKQEYFRIINRLREKYPQDSRLKIFLAKELLYKEPAKALELFRAVHQTEQETYALYNLARAQELVGDYPGALKSLETLKKDFPQKNKMLLSWEAELFFKNQDFLEFISFYQKLDHSELSFQEKLSLSEAYFKLGKVDQAEKILIEIVETEDFKNLTKKRKTKVFLKMAKLYEEKQEYDQALRNYNKALLNQEGKAEVKLTLLSSAKILSRQGELIQADRIFKSLVSLYPDEASLFYQYAQIKDQQKKHFEAVRFYQKALTLDNLYSKDSEFLKKYAQSFTNTHSWVTSAMLWENYLRLEPKDLRAWLTLAKIRTRQNKTDLALNSYQEALELGGNRKSILEKIIWIYDQRKDWKALENTSKELILLSRPRNSNYYLLHAKALLKQSKREQAIQFLLNKQSEISSLDFYLKSGEFILEHKDYYSASSVYQKALSLYQGNLTATLGLANSYKAIGLFEKARDLYQVYLKRVPSNYQARNSFAESLYYANQEKQAIEEYQKVIKSKPNLPDAYYALGSIFINTDLEKAKRFWQKHLSLDQQSKYRYQIYYYFPDLK